MKILYVTNSKTSWTSNDYKILEKHFQITNNFVSSFKDSLKGSNPIFILKHDVIIFWFASLKFFPILVVAWLLKRKIVIIAGGYDVVKEPSIKYGAFEQPWPLRIIRRLMFMASDKIISVSYSNQKEAWENAKVPLKKSIMIYHGFSNIQIPLKEFRYRKKQILTIGALNNDTYLRKGHKYFLEIAKRMPEWNFIIIGQVTSDFLHLNEFVNCKNLTLAGFVPNPKFNEILNDSKFYLQLSQHEGFGCSIVDAALMGCYPIVFDRYAMPEVVDGCGEIVKFKDLKSIENAIYKLEEINIDVELIRSHYLNKFQETQRERKLTQLISSLK